MRTTKQTIDTSIVLATCSRAALLRGSLESLLAQNWIAHDGQKQHVVEFILVDDGSTDATPDVLRAFQHRAWEQHGIPVTLLQGERTGIAAARNLGFANASGLWIASFDDDQIAPAGWLRALRERVDKTDAAGAGGALVLELPTGVQLASFGPRTRTVLGEHLLGEVARVYRGGKDLPATNNALLRREVYLAAGPFDTRYTEGGEDKDLFRRVLAAGHSLWFEPAAQAGHITPETRLAESNIRWTSLRLGASDARIALADGPLSALKLACTRALVAAVRDTPALLIAKVRHSRRAELEARCSLWYTQGLLRALPELLSPDHSQQHFLRSLDFRRRNGERRERTLDRSW